MSDIPTPLPTNPVVLDVLSPSATGSAEPPSSPSGTEALPFPTSDADIEEGSILAELAQAMQDSDAHNLLAPTPTSEAANSEDEDDEDSIPVDEAVLPSTPPVDPAAAPSATPPAPDPASPPAPSTSPLDLNKIAERFYGQSLTEDQAVTFLQFSSDVERLARNDPQRFQQVQQLLNGQPLQTPQTQPSIAPTVQPSAIPTPVSPTPEYVDPDVAAALNPVVASQQQLQAQFDQLQVYNQQQEFNRVQQENQNRAEQVNKAEQEWRTSKESITPEEYVSFSAHLQSTLRTAPGLFPSFLDANNGDTVKATHALLDHFYWQDPTFREREIHNQVARERADQVEQRKKTSKSSALTGGGGGKASSAEPPPSTKSGRIDAMANELAEIFKQ